MVPIQWRAVWWIRISFKAEADTVFLISMLIQTNADPCRYGCDFKVTKRWIFKITGQEQTKEGTGTKAFWKLRERGLFVNFGKFSCSWTGSAFRIRFGSRTAKLMRKHIYNTGWKDLLSDLKVLDLNLCPSSTLQTGPLRYLVSDTIIPWTIRRS